MFDFNDENKAKMLLVAEDLQGTCQSLDDAIQKQFGEDADPMAMHIELLRTLDDQVMLCECCGWWCETHELNSNQVCSNCDPANDEDE